MNVIEEVFVKTFVARNMRSRWLTRLVSIKTRSKILGRLAHTFELDLDPRFVYDKDNLPTDIAVRVEKVLNHWKKANPEHLCHIMASSRDRDGEMMNLEEAEADYSLTFGAVIIIIPHKLAYYHTERSNINKEPFYVLFHP